MARVTGVALVVALAWGAAAQKQSSGPRALAVVQAGTNGMGRLLPIAIQVEGRFYDAGIYRASPVPMALEPGTVYEITQAGESLGLFTIRIPAETANGAWSATGKYEDKHALEAAKAKGPSMTVTPQGTKADAEDRPVLRKNPRKDTNITAPPSTPGATAPNTAPPPTATSGNNPPPPPGSTDTGAGGPHAGRSGPPADVEAQAPDRPILHRGKPETEHPESAKSSAAEGVSPGPRSGYKPKVTPARLLPAVSDADGPEPRPYYFVPHPGEAAELQNKVTQMAQEEVARYERARRPSFGSAQITPQDFRIFDLDSSNQPVFVLTATARITERNPGRRSVGSREAASTPSEAFLTVVAHEDVYGELQPMFASVTDPQHLDEFPRLQLVDAVDADGDGRGELLFQEIGAGGSGWVIYKPGPDKLATLYDSFSGH